jgi:hypothetical protein
MIAPVRAVTQPPGFDPMSDEEERVGGRGSPAPVVIIDAAAPRRHVLVEHAHEKSSLQRGQVMLAVALADPRTALSKEAAEAH